MVVGFLGLDSTQDSEVIHQHDTMCEFGLVIKDIDFMIILRDSSEGENVVQIHAQRCVNVHAALSPG